jgi:hypothetical protein
MTRTAQATFSCPCHSAKFTVQERPLTRFICHCRICQAVYKAPFADITAFTGSALSVSTPDQVSFKRLRLPPAVNRGICNGCGSPVVGFLRVAPFFKIGFVPTRNLAALGGELEPKLHIFYHRRVADVSDALPKVSGYWASELAVTGAVLKSLLKGAA